MKVITKITLGVLSFAMVLASYQSAEAKRGNADYQGKYQQGQSSAVTDTASDQEIVRAVNSQRRLNFVEGGSLVVTKVLPDDTNGNEHQKWMVRLSNGKTMQAVYNSDMCPRVPVKEGDVIAMGGEFIWTNRGALLHWLHHDPRGNRPDGYVYLNGKFYCKDSN